MDENIEKFDLRGKTAEEVVELLEQQGFSVYAADMTHKYAQAFSPAPERVQYVFLHNAKTGLPVFVLGDGSEHQAHSGDALKLFHRKGEQSWVIGGTYTGCYPHLDAIIHHQANRK